VTTTRSIHTRRRFFTHANATNTDRPPCSITRLLVNINVSFFIHRLLRDVACYASLTSNELAGCDRGGNGIAPYFRHQRWLTVSLGSWFIENLIALKIVSIIVQNVIVRKYKTLIVLKSGKFTRMSMAVLRVYNTPEVFKADQTFGCNPINHPRGRVFLFKISTVNNNDCRICGVRCCTQQRQGAGT